MDDSRFDALACAFSRRSPRRALLAALGGLLPATAAAKKRKRRRLGKACDGITDTCKDGDCIDGLCACPEHKEPCRGRCVRLDTCCPRRRPRRCGNQCIPKKACCRARNECACGSGCIRCGQCCSDANCPNDPDDVCWTGVCRNRSCDRVIHVGQPCGPNGLAVCTETGRCEVPACTSDVECKLLPGEDSRCTKRHCVLGACRPTYESDGTPLGNWVPGDCKANVCVADGRVGTIIDNSDKPGESDQCLNPWCDDGIPRCT